MSTPRDRSILDKSPGDVGGLRRQDRPRLATFYGGWPDSVCLAPARLPFMQVLDPSWEGSPPSLALAPRLKAVAGIDIALLSNGKAGVAPLFDHVEALLKNRWGGASVERATKGNYSAPVEPELARRLARRRLVITGVGD